MGPADHVDALRPVAKLLLLVRRTGNADAEPSSVLDIVRLAEWLATCFPQLEQLNLKGFGGEEQNGALVKAIRAARTGDRLAVRFGFW